MDSLLPALIAALLAGAADRPAWLAAILGDRFGGRASVLLGVAGAQAAIMAIAAVGALAVRDVMTPNAKALFFGVALIFAGAGALMPPRPPRDRLEGWRIGPLPTAALGSFILAFGERVQFVGFGAAAWSASPVLAASGAALGAMTGGVIAATLGEREWRRLPLRIIGGAGGTLLLASGIVMGLGGLRLI
ncbi:hypothetical protein COC42_06535 [Sphingomonas spermidinifaciens]|uniref:GDT1 family protein n=1 Tax=Sphingomonas spermidinifaciens TaxID=1141889 RepID=A0A2A4B6A0_9SPHN|nr:hypothetical protein [Sphingomonas spermidinifaciens]PCD03971.1 hypothetical protein COC42_06535 [Sphingomonas spermidinifaciens]